MMKKRSRYLELLVVFLIAYAICLGLRLLEAPAWQASHLQVSGEKLLATHDAYFWVAGAKGTSRAPGAALAQISSFLHSFTGIKLGNLAFWLPALISPLAILPIVLLGRFWRVEEGALPASILAGASLGFLLRTRIGFFDTDILTLFFPLMFCIGLIIWLSHYLSIGYKGAEAAKELDLTFSENHVLVLFGLSFCLGLWGCLYLWFYSAGYTILLTMFALALICAWIWKGSKWNFLYLTLGLLLMYGISFAGWLGALLALVFIAILYMRPWLIQHTKGILIMGIILALLFFILTNLPDKIYHLIEKVLSYAKISSSAPSGEEGSSLSLPSIAQSVREAQNISLSQTISRIAGNWWIFTLGLIGYGYLVWRKPLAILFLPFLGLALASAKLGNRFSMYGGAAIGMGLGFGISLFFARYNLSKRMRWLVQIILCIAALWPIYNIATQIGPAPILPKVYAKTFIELQEKTPKDARLWQWWDYGYAAQYYAERATFGDGGGRYHKGPYLFPMARVHMSHSPLQVNQIMKFSTETQQDEYQNNASQFKNAPLMWRPYLADPVTELREMGPKKAKAFINSLAQDKKEWSKDLPEQYLVFSWENLRLAYWISYYGSWDLVTGQASPGKIQMIKGKAQLNLKEGAITIDQGNIPLDTVAIVNDKKTIKRDYANGTNIYALFNQLSQEIYLMDKKIYESMMVQMLIEEPEKYKDHFELVVNRYPWTRVYRAK